MSWSYRRCEILIYSVHEYALDYLAQVTAIVTCFLSYTARLSVVFLPVL